MMKKIILVVLIFGMLSTTTLAGSLQPLPGCSNAPKDPNSDGLCEDVNGDGILDFADVTTLYNNMFWVKSTGIVSFFDYNKNGRMDFADIVRLNGMV